jgi:hypothetical protein
MARRNDYFKTSPITMTYKFFNDTVTLKREVYDLTPRNIMDMNRTLIISVFNEELYEETIMSIASDIRKKQNIFQRIIGIFK